MKVSSMRLHLLLAIQAVACLSASASTLTWNGGNSGVWQDGGSGWTGSGGSANWSNATPDSAVFAGVTPTGVTLGSDITSATISLLSSENYVVSGPFTITTTAGDGALSVRGGGSLTLNNNAIVNGQVGVSGATLSFGGTTSSNSVFGFVVGDFGDATMNVASGGSLAVNGSRLMVIGLQSNSSLNVAGSLTVGSDVNIGIGSVYSIFGNGGTGQLNVSSGGVATIAGDSNSRIYVANPGDSSTGNFEGSININGGALVTHRTISEGAGSTSGSKTSAVTINDGGTLRASGDNSNWIDSSIDSFTIGSGGGSLDSNGFNVVVNANTTAQGDFTKNGAGTVSVAGSTNTFAGKISVRGGQLNLGGTSTSTNKVEVNSGGVLNVTGALTTTHNSEAVIAGDYSDGTISVAAGGSLNIQGSRFILLGLQSTGNINVNGGNLNIGSSVDVWLGSAFGIYGDAGTGNLNVSGGTASIQGTSAQEIILANPSAGTNGDFVGAVNITGGVLATGRTFVEGASLGNGQRSSSIAINGGTLKALDNNSNWIASTGSRAIDTLTFGSNGATIDSNGFDVVIAKGAGGTNGSLNKTGTGNLTLGGLNTYDGPTTVSEGTLLLSAGGSIASNDLSIAVGAEFDVTAKTSYGLGLLSTTTFSLDNIGSGYFDEDGIANFGLDGALVLNFTSLPAMTTYNLLDYLSQTGDFASVTAAGALTGAFSLTAADTWTSHIGEYTLTFDETTGNLSVIPEPGTVGLLVCAGVGAFFLRRRRSDI